MIRVVDYCRASEQQGNDDAGERVGDGGVRSHGVGGDCRSG